MKEDITFTVSSVIDRLQRRVYPRVQKDAVACDNIRLACRALRRLIEQPEADTEPIDIFNI